MTITLEKLEQERDNIILATLTGQKVDFRNLREMCKEFQKNNDVNFEIEGTDEELWSSVSTYFRDILKK